MFGTIKKIFHRKSLVTGLLAAVLFAALAGAATPTVYAYDWSKAPYAMYYGESSCSKADRAKVVKKRNDYIRGLLEDKWTCDFYGFKDTDFQKYPGYEIDDATKQAMDMAYGKMDEKTDQIIQGKKSDMAKYKAIHKWVAKNIYYDYDAVNGKSEYHLDAWDAFSHRRSTCWGYASVEVYMLKHCGIPGVVAYGKACGAGGWEKTEEFDEGAHSWVMAYIDGEWYTSDPTWDSGNRYKNGKYIQKVQEMRCFCMSDEMVDKNYAIRAINRNELSKGKKTGFFKEGGKVYYYYYGKKITAAEYMSKEGRPLPVGIWHDDRTAYQ